MGDEFAPYMWNGRRFDAERPPGRLFPSGLFKPSFGLSGIEGLSSLVAVAT